MYMYFAGKCFFLNDLNSLARRISTGLFHFAMLLLFSGCRPPPPSWHVPGPNSHIEIPVFEMHQVLPGENSEYVISTEFLKKLIEGLNRRGFTSITPSQLEAALFDGGPLPPRPALLSFDDGFRDSYDYALPILRHYGWSAIFFIPTDKIAETEAARVNWGSGTEPRAMIWPEVLKCRKAGIYIGSHSCSHINLRKADEDTIRRELSESRLVLEDHLNESITWLAYPGGKRDERVRRIASETGYTMAFKSDGGTIECLNPENQRFALHRVDIAGYIDPENILKTIPDPVW